MKKLVVLVMTIAMLLCTAAQAAPKVINLSTLPIPEDPDMPIEITVSGDTVITGKTNHYVYIDHKGGVITLENAEINTDDMYESLIIATVRPMVEVKLVGTSMLTGTKGSALATQTALKLTGIGNLLASSDVGIMTIGDVVIDGCNVTAIGAMSRSQAGIATMNGSLIVNSGRVRAYCYGEDDFIKAAYLNSIDGDVLEAGKVKAAEGSVIRTGEMPVSMAETGAYNGEMCLEIIAPAAIPETGDGANLALWTLMLAASVIGVLSMRRKAY